MEEKKLPEHLVDFEKLVIERKKHAMEHAVLRSQYDQYTRLRSIKDSMYNEDLTYDEEKRMERKRLALEAYEKDHICHCRWARMMWH